MYPPSPPILLQKNDLPPILFGQEYNTHGQSFLKKNLLICFESYWVSLFPHAEC